MSIATHEQLVSVRAEASNALYAPFASKDGVLMVKGFVSTDIPDREGARFDPQEFDVAEFMTAPALLVNHALWTNSTGNQGGVGLVKSLAAAKVRRGSTAGTFSIYDLDGKREIDVVPKESFPNLRVGVTGLWGVLAVTDEEVIRKVEAGELRGISWRGVGEWGYMTDSSGGQVAVYKTLKGIKIWEVSLVTVAANSGSYAVTKSVIKDVTANPAVEGVLRWSRFKIPNVQTAGTVEMVRFLGDQVVFSVLTGATPPHFPVVEGVSPMSEQNPVTTPDVPALAPGLSDEVRKSIVTEAVEAAKSVLAPMITETASGLTAALSSVKALTDASAEMTRQLGTLTAEIAASKAAPAPAPAPVAVIPTTLEDTMKGLQAAMGEVARSLGAVVPPTREPRSEGTAPKTPDSNSVFDNLFPAPMRSK